MKAWKDKNAAMLADMPSEMAPLVQALNQLFERIERMMASERRFTADAAHELRTPIAGIRTQVQVAKGAGGPEDKGTGPGEWNLPHKLAVDAQENLYMTTITPIKIWMAAATPDEQELLAQAQQLYRRILAGAEPFLQGAAHLMVVPDDALHVERPTAGHAARASRLRLSVEK